MPHQVNNQDPYLVSKRRAMIAELCFRAGMIGDSDRYESTKAYSVVNECSGLMDIMRACVGSGASVSDPRALVERALTTSDFPAVLAGVANKALAVAYGYAPGTFHLWMSQGSCKDFKTNSIDRLIPPSDLPEVLEDGVFKALKVSDGAANVRLRTFGGILSLSRQALINDDLGALKDRGRVLGITTKSTQNRLAYKVLLANPVLSDGVAVFDTSRNNYFSGVNTVLGRDSMATAVKSMRNMMDPEGNVLALEPKYLLVPPSLEITAHELCYSDSIPGQANSAVPNLFKKLGIVPIVEPLLESPSLAGSSATAWYLLPDQRLWPVFSALSLGEPGNFAPYVESQVQFKNDNVETKVRTDFSVAAVGYTAVKMKGAA